MDTFNIDYERGKETELLFRDILRTKYPTADKVEGYEKRWDVIIPNSFKFEVKHDEKSLKTGNYFIEKSYVGRPSGIDTSQADFWVLYDTITWVMINTDTLRFLCKSAKVKEEHNPINNDYSVSAYLIKKELVQEHNIMDEFFE